MPKIKDVNLLKNYEIEVLFDDGARVIFDLKTMMKEVPVFNDLKKDGLFEKYKIDESRTCLYWTDMIDLPSDGIYDFGKHIN